MKRMRMFRIGSLDREPNKGSTMKLRIVVPFVAICVMVLFALNSCNKKQPEPATDIEQSRVDEQPEESAEEAPETPEEAEADETTIAVKNQHVVIEGECLWRISGHEDVYGDPYRWSDIYEANQNQIADPDLIYPGQRFTIPR